MLSLKWEARPVGQTSSVVANRSYSGDSSRQEVGPELWVGKVQEAEQAFMGRVRHQRQHEGEPRGKQPELGWWPVGPAPPQRLRLLEPRISEGEGALEDHLAQSSTNKKDVAPVCSSSL